MGPSSTSAAGPLLSLLAVCCAALLFREARAYSGTVPIFPDVAAGKKQEAAKAYEMQCKRRFVRAPGFNRDDVVKRRTDNFDGTLVRTAV